ncbi:hypothetical protein VitviT2T_004228 [Vitis vinifera]|uniref:Pentatricopeptide repeat-containing protein n=1 Tax=Vitis vinifera TaxID=29760 RepID=A0ABY9BPV9_VITVI|nr:hypothetical protein VitviT2T_004228 [Vitis vinifera]
MLSSNHHKAVNMVKKMPAYKNRLWSLELEHTGGATNKKKTHKQMNKKMEEELSKELELQMKGAKKTLYIWELIGVHIVLLPLAPPPPSCLSSTFNSFSFSFLLKACAYLQHRKGGLQLHALTLKAGFEFHVYLHTVLLNVYAVCGALLEAKQVLDEMPVRNSVTWNVLITGLAKWGELHLARSLFDEMPMPTVVSWTTIIDGYTRMNQPKQALALFRTMFIDEGIKPTEIALLAIFPAISNLGALELCQLVHMYGEKSGLNASDIRIRNSLLDTYAKCGCMESIKGLWRNSCQEQKLGLMDISNLRICNAWNGERSPRNFERMFETKPNNILECFKCL